METIAAKSLLTSSHTIPLDLFMDVVRVLLNNGLNWQIEGINEKENSLLIQVSIQQGSIQYRKALENIQGFLSDYGYYLKGSPSSEPE